MSTAPTAEQSEASAKLNDLARGRIGLDTMIYRTSGFMRLSAQDQSAVCECIKSYDVWNICHSIDSERDFGVIFKQTDGNWTTDTPDREGWPGAVFWAISYYCPTFSKRSDTPWDGASTARVLKLMLPDEYR